MPNERDTHIVQHEVNQSTDGIHPSEQTRIRTFRPAAALDTPSENPRPSRRPWVPVSPTITEEMRETLRSYPRPQEDIEQMERYRRILTSPPIPPIPAVPPVTPPAPVDDVIRAGDTVVRLLGGSPLLRTGDTYRVASVDSLYGDILIEGSDGTFTRHYFKKVTSGRRERKLSGFGEFVKKLDSEDKINQSEGRQ